MTLLTTEKDIGAAAVNGAPAVVRYLVEISWERLVGPFKANFPERTEKELLMASAAVGGANRTAIEFSLAGIIKIPPKELGEYLLRWHMRALELSPRQIDRVVRIAAAGFKKGV